MFSTISVVLYTAVQLYVSTKVGLYIFKTTKNKMEKSVIKHKILKDKKAI